MGTFSGLSKFERRIMAACALLMVVCIGFLLSEDFERWIGHGAGGARGPKIGQIIKSRKDVRRKVDGDVQWRDIESAQKVYLGDSIFAGRDSGADIALDGANQIHLDPNSMIRFSDIKGLHVGDVVRGTFTVKVEGELTLAVGGELRHFRGTQSEIEVKIAAPGQKPVIKITRGDVAMEEVHVPEAVEPTRAGEVATEDLLPVPDGDIPEVLHVWNFKDLYAETGGILRARVATQVDVNMNLHWDGFGHRDFRVQIAALPDFSGERFFVDAKDAHVAITRAFDGDNHWRVSADGTRWSRRADFRVHSIYLDARLDATFATQDLVILNEVPESEIKWQSETAFPEYLVEVAREPGFDVARTKILRLNEPVLRARFGEQASYFLRARGMSADGSLTEYSAVSEVRVRVPARLAAPQLPAGEIVYPLFSSVKRALPWLGPQGADHFVVEVLDKDQKLIEKRAVRGQSASLPKLTPGDYFYRVTGVDAYSRLGVPSETKGFAILAPPPAPLVVEKPIVLEETPPLLAERAPDSESATSAVRFEAPLEFLNDFRETRLSFEAATFGMLSSEQSYQNKSSPTAGTFALRARRYFTNGFAAEGSFKTKAFDMNAQAANIAPWNAELRAMWFGRTHWISFLREMEWNIFAGGETYRNANSGLFIPRYDLLKLGAGIEFPLWNRITTGGEASYGMTSDAGHKLEVSGFANYFIQKNWSLGGGYRVHLFEAGSARNVPAGVLPYREGYVEGFSALKYSY